MRFPGGDLDVEWTEDDRALLTGPATFVFEAELDDGWVAAVTRTARSPEAAR